MEADRQAERRTLSIVFYLDCLRGGEADLMSETLDCPAVTTFPPSSPSSGLELWANSSLTGERTVASSNSVLLEYLSLGGF